MSRRKIENYYLFILLAVVEPTLAAIMRVYAFTSGRASDGRANDSILVHIGLLTLHRLLTCPFGREHRFSRSCLDIPLLQTDIFYFFVLSLISFFFCRFMELLSTLFVFVRFLRRSSYAFV